ncbi:MAG: hypothetical protein AAGF96_19795 [Bacteroidota bacterium]
MHRRSIELVHDERLVMQLCGIAAMVTALTTFLLWLLPKFYPAFEQYATAPELHDNIFYISRQWVNLFHIPLAIAGYFGLAYTLREREPAKVCLGMLWFLIWGIVEMMGVSGIIFAVNRNWRAKFQRADTIGKEMLQSSISEYFAIWDGMFFVLLISFLLGTTFFGWATWKGNGLERWLSYFFWMAVPLTLLIIFSRYFGINWAGGIVGIIYPILQPISRFVLGLHLIKR